MTQALKIRLDEAAELFRRGVAPVIIVCGWRPLNRPDLTRYSESQVMEEYLVKTYGHEPWAKNLVVMREPHSTSVPENLILVSHQFANLEEITIVVGELVVPRVMFFARAFFSPATTVRSHGCADGIGTAAKELRLLGDAQCTIYSLSDKGFLALKTPLQVDGVLTSRWDELRQQHHDCQYYGGLHPWQR